MKSVCTAVALLGLALSIPGTASAATQTLKVGTLALQPCVGGTAWCGSIARPIDPAGEVPGTIPIAFEYHPRRDTTQPALGTIVAAEGGPGYSTTASRSYYLELFKPLMDRRSLLMVDNRGTGLSAPIDCRRLQLEYPITQEAVAACGATLGDTSDLYGTGLAADDLAAVLDALQTGKIDLYGDSYGTYFSQTFAGRHPTRLRSLTLDGAYQVTHLSPWYPANAATVRYAFDTVCERAAACRDLPGSSLERLSQLAASLRAAPISGSAPDGNGNTITVTAEPSALAFAMFTAGFSKIIYRELDAAARAYLDNSDSAPLLRILAETQGDYYPRVVDKQLRFLSSGLYVAVSCSDYPQIYDMTATPAQRSLQRDAAVAKKNAANPDLYAPFTIEEFAGMPLDYSLLDLCLSWPVPSAAHLPGVPVPADVKFTAAPTLVLSGELDTVTAPPSGAAAAAQFQNSQQVIVANSFHVTALGDTDDCASKLVRRFVSTLSPGDTSCSTGIVEIRTTPAFARSYQQVALPQAGAGNQAKDKALRAAAAAVQSVGDAMNRWWVNYDGDGVGLRGGSYSVASQGSGVYHYALDTYQWTADLPVSGTIDWDRGSGAVSAQVTVSGGKLQVTWNDAQPGAIATVTGKLDGKTVVATLPAP
ncbi:MAG: hypothetical protein JWQ90_2645 [Hydrocarboniphaga sp.]|uniref:alpha/beta fold hydrolase n=1 Tax=Hydrocarboniphaga sp. TaxID=2033016 RepID=UPI00260EC150|nr:alpha/beta hydrolase [Hydrocarboniphaga sp.]MDB5970195.1 hypothetical protein [Hydrocarboniphaga sp.]